MRIGCFLLLLTHFLLSCNAGRHTVSTHSGEKVLEASEVLELGINLGYGIKSLAALPSDSAWALLVGSTHGVYLLMKDGQKKVSADILQGMDISAFTFQDGTTILMLAALLRGDNILRCYRILHGASLQQISAGDIPSSVDQVTDIQLRRTNSEVLAYVIGQRGQMEMWRLFDPGWGQVDASVSSHKSSPYPAQYIDVQEQILCGSSINKGVWCTGLEEGFGTVRVRAISKEQLKQKLSIRGMALLPGEKMLIAWSNGMIERMNTGQMKTETQFKVRFQGGWLSDPALMEWVAPGTWAVYPDGGLLLLLKSEGGAQLAIIPASELLK
jgi:hypothetical protein